MSVKEEAEDQSSLQGNVDMDDLSEDLVEEEGEDPRGNIKDPIGCGAEEEVPPEMEKDRWENTSLQGHVDTGEFLSLVEGAVNGDDPEEFLSQVLERERWERWSLLAHFDPWEDGLPLDDDEEEGKEKPEETPSQDDFDGKVEDDNASRISNTPLYEEPLPLDEEDDVKDVKMEIAIATREPPSENDLHFGGMVDDDDFCRNFNEEEDGGDGDFGEIAVDATEKESESIVLGNLSFFTDPAKESGRRPAKSLEGKRTEESVEGEKAEDEERDHPAEVDIPKKRGNQLVENVKKTTEKEIDVESSEDGGHLDKEKESLSEKVDVATKDLSCDGSKNANQKDGEGGGSEANEEPKKMDLAQLLQLLAQQDDGGNGSAAATAPTNPGGKQFPVDGCSQKCPSDELLRKHMRVHRGPFICGICKRQSAGRSSLRRHFRTHTGERPHKCDTCGFSISQAGNLKTHQRIHTGDTPHRCSICGKPYTQSTGLSKHMRKIHNIGAQ